MRKLSRKKPSRESMIRNLVTSLVLYESIYTTQAKAKETTRSLERIISRSKSLNLSSKLKIYSYFYDKNAAKKMIKEIVPRYDSRNSGYIKSYKSKRRLGDNSLMVRLKLINDNELKSNHSENQPSKREVKAK